METNNLRPNAQAGEPTADTGDWRATLQPEKRQRIVNKIIDTLKIHLPYSGQEGLDKLVQMAVRFEEKIYSAAISQSDYSRKLCLMMLTMESKSQNKMPNTVPQNPAGNGNRPADLAAFQRMQAQVHNQGRSPPGVIQQNPQSDLRRQMELLML